MTRPAELDRDEELTQQIVMEVLAAKTRKDVVPHYAAGIEARPRPWFGDINAAIEARWSKAGLKWIKQQAWHIVDAHTVERLRAA